MIFNQILGLIKSKLSFLQSKDCPHAKHDDAIDFTKYRRGSILLAGDNDNFPFFQKQARK
jgi:hypothetical protein